ncbi:MAG: hypothetical protein AB1403_03645 [Candidatus Riflebacteria bacterium]
MGKESRQQAIVKIIRGGRISSQQMLLDELSRAGHSMTQATLSRDLKALGVVKQPLEDGSYTYSTVDDMPAKNLQSVPFMNGNAFLSIEFSGNCAVAKTLPGFASGLASTIDGLKLNCFLGSVAGDDTIILIVRENVSRDELRSELLERIPALGLKVHI